MTAFWQIFLAITIRQAIFAAMLELALCVICNILIGREATIELSSAPESPVFRFMLITLRLITTVALHKLMRTHLRLVETLKTKQIELKNLV